MNWIMHLLRLYNSLYSFAVHLWMMFCFRNDTWLKPSRQYFLSDDYEFDASFTHVPEDTVYIEEWFNRDGEKKCIVRYEGEEIPHEWIDTPFDRPTPRCPWVWVGDTETELDLTRTFQKFLVPGNRILLDLVLKLIQVNERTRLVYIDPVTFEEHEFPGDGITI